MTAVIDAYNRQSAEDFAATFTDDGVFIIKWGPYAGTYEGEQEIIGIISRQFKDFPKANIYDLEFTKVDISEDKATAEYNYKATMGGEWSINHKAELVKEDGTWKFKKSVLG